MSRHRPPQRAERITALLECPLIHDIAHELGAVGRRTRQHPIAFHLAWAAMARLIGSQNRLDAELANPAQWATIVDQYNNGANAHPHGVPMNPYARPLLADTYRHVRDHLTTDPTLDDLRDAFTHHSVTIARTVGLLDPATTSSRTHPHPTRAIYGDGTIVRPLYGRETSPDDTEPGDDDGGERRRIDPDAAKHSRHDTTVWGNNLVTIAARGPGIHHRVILAVGRVDQPGREAATAVDLIRNVHHHAGDGIQTVIYDGAFRGVHHETLMTELGLIVVNKVHPATNTDNNRTYRHQPLGQWHHTIGRRTCTHTLVAHNGSVHDTALDDAGELHLSDPLPRRQIRRYPRSSGGGYRFSLGVTIPCPREPFTAWISPHPQPGDPGTGRPDQLRLIPETDTHFQTLYGLRNDSEAINSAYKRTLIADRAPALGWRRQVLDLLSWAILTNTLTWSSHNQRAPEGRLAGGR